MRGGRRADRDLSPGRWEGGKDRGKQRGMLSCGGLGVEVECAEDKQAQGDVNMCLCFCLQYGRRTHS